ncbi:MAG TPA: hypothetical protein VMB51_01080 [Solirubrobacteraceae bacterium]|nr:hypothetical protein [Solirubrobacteraceae bacterium]
MLLLVTQAMPQMRRHEHPNLGRLVTPRHFCSLDQHEGLAWAADNDCFQRLDPHAYCAMLDALLGAPGRCLFVTVPDVVADAHATARLFEIWWRALARRGLPAALVAQDGLEHLYSWLTFVWPRIDALFIGGSTEWKLGPAAHALAIEAKRRGKWVHMGRVNSARRIRYAASIGCDSVDGTKWVRWRDAYLDAGLSLMTGPVQLPLHWTLAADSPPLRCSHAAHAVRAGKGPPGRNPAWGADRPEK